MENKLKVGDKVLIFDSAYYDDYDTGINWYYPIKPFIRGEVIEQKRNNFSRFSDGNWYITVYKVLGEDGEIYVGPYKRSLVCNSFFYTEDDYIEYLNDFIRLNEERIKEINKITEEIKENIELIKGNITEEKRLKYEKR